MIKDKILIVEDEKSIANFMKTILTSNNYDVLISNNGNDAIAMASSHCPDLIILDLGLPDIDGTEVIDKIRQWSQTPIIIVSARNFEKDKVDAFDRGADDYLTKPFGSSELLARIRVAIKHARSEINNEAIKETGKYTLGDLVVDYDKHQVLINDENTHLTQNEYKIVSLLAKYAGKVLTYDFIMKEIWGPQSNNNNQILRVNMANIRRKIEKNPAQPVYIFTEVGVGYRMPEIL